MRRAGFEQGKKGINAIQDLKQDEGAHGKWAYQKFDRDKGGPCINVFKTWSRMKGHRRKVHGKSC